jgi:hypothetical protein
VSAQRRLRRQVARQDGQRLRRACPYCDGYIELRAAEPDRSTIHHGDGCPARHRGPEQLVAEIKAHAKIAAATGREVGPMVITPAGTIIGLVEPDDGVEQ